MRKKSNNTTTTEKKQTEAIEKALRSYGYLFPQSADEIESLNKIIGSTATPLPDSLKDPAFLFSKKQKIEDAKIIPLIVAAPEDFYDQAYAAHDEQDSISLKTTSKMNANTKKVKQKNSKAKKKKN